jgi:uncharacterized membrane protein
MSGVLAELTTAAQWLLAQLKITASNIGDIAAALSHVHLTWLIRPFVAVVALWLIFKIVRKARK